ncbi:MULTISPECIES: NAD-dependent epimerase/dehydratase family protein [Clostridium]|uniref:NAD-dependent epimerase/dehydratase family protein n=1 Tax=Clostridium TaxID=1485 RepID=UPI00129AB86A|nr:MULTISPECIES: NAD-dependent epimerase/dehydratase family protein [Clostridium]MDU1068724.1 NAD-dependent epimerase/dehydratase family protein [Clostridium sp.]MDU1336967.1 NAD-dependent epimerase/dehydratase family protein [Clostridium butyricum]MDU2676308.1 NAD-dependent epimerase/dehydratase family protein [Clostridium sp.]MDU4210655.1 NAD-dependent epimerase/dehydratase family protein [Clostridium sp.]MDU5173913.1 NAD-dependent epimerase/dehydratase family protein [Clostridium sp.]
MIKNKRILLTGGAGFIGTKLCEVLSEKNKILIYDNLNRNSIKNTKLLDRDNIRLIEGDILDFQHIKEVVNEFKPQIIIHLAAVAGIDTVIRNPVNTMQVNMIGTYNILESIKNLNIERFIDFSTSEVFGSYAYKVDEKHTTNLAPVGEARWTYSVSKLAGEHLAHSYYKQYGLPIVTVRPFNIYGPGQVGEGAVHHFVKRAIVNEEIQIHGDGDQIRSWCYIDDFVQGILLCIEKDEAVGNSFNIGNPKGTITISMLAKLVKDIAKSKSEIVYILKTYVDVELRIPSIDKAKEILGYIPKYDLEVGIERTINWYRGELND